LRVKVLAWVEVRPPQLFVDVFVPSAPVGDADVKQFRDEGAAFVWSCEDEEIQESAVEENAHEAEDVLELLDLFEESFEREDGIKLFYFFD